MKRILIAACVAAAAAGAGASPDAKPFTSETECYAFLSGLQGVIDAYSMQVSGIRIPPEGTEMFEAIRAPLQSMVDLQRDVADQCLSFNLE
jgi:hypothetical protein